MPTQYDVTDTHQVSTRILEAVADQRGVDPLELQPPLYEVIDPEALEALFAPTGGGKRNGRIEFTYAGCRITVTAGTDRTITVENAARPGHVHDRNSGRKQLLD